MPQASPEMRFQDELDRCYSEKVKPCSSPILPRVIEELKRQQQDWSEPVADPYEEAVENLQLMGFVIPPAALPKPEKKLWLPARLRREIEREKNQEPRKEYMLDFFMYQDNERGAEISHQLLCGMGVPRQALMADFN